MLTHSNTVYKINSTNCETSYVGQAGRLLKTRINEHRSRINRNSSQHSVITEHRVNTGHDFNWNGVKIVDEEKSLNKRLVSVMIFIYKQKQSLNLQRDMKLLDLLWSSFKVLILPLLCFSVNLLFFYMHTYYYSLKYCHILTVNFKLYYFLIFDCTSVELLYHMINSYMINS